MEILPILVFNVQGKEGRVKSSTGIGDIRILNAMTAMAQLLLLLTLRSVVESLQVT